MRATLIFSEAQKTQLLCLWSPDFVYDTDCVTSQLNYQNTISLSWLRLTMPSLVPFWKRKRIPIMSGHNASPTVRISSSVSNSYRQLDCGSCSGEIIVAIVKEPTQDNQHIVCHCERRWSSTPSLEAGVLHTEPLINLSQVYRHGHWLTI